ncbi:MAG TPA: DUF362 domain-containing protein [Bryobacteraceae bacterium]|nr:DUF362 domain-containing protein [Bryobacteraceae bacterium]
MNLGRRRMITAAGVAVGGMATARLLPEEMLLRDRRLPRSRVAIISAEEYSETLEGVLASGLRAFHLNVRGKSVLLKPNLVDYIAGVEINTHPVLVGATAQAFLKLGASSVVVGEGPGHQRDTYLVLAESGLADQLRGQNIHFVDLNRDELFKVPTRATYTGLEHLWLPRTVLNSDFVVSMPKIKTHHWAGVTLSMKNMFGVVPGAKYGWPKNVLHWKGIHRSILDICATAPVNFVIADGIVAMEGNGPLHGTHRHLGKIVLADDPVAADFTCARLMGLDPYRVWHLARAAQFLGNGSYDRIDLIAEGLPLRTDPFDVLPEFAGLQMRL